MPKSKVPEKRFRLLIDTYERRGMLFSGSGRKQARIDAKLQELLKTLQHLAPGHEFKAYSGDEFVKLLTPMPRDEMRALFFAASQACECDLV